MSASDALCPRPPDVAARAASRILSDLANGDFWSARST